MNSEIFEKLSPTRLFFRCALPAMVTMAFGALYSVADGLFVGRFVGEDALAAINLVMPVVMMAEALSNMIATGSTVKIAVLLGEKRREDASAVFCFSLKMIFVISVILGAAGFVFARPFLQILAPGATPAALGYSVTYLRVYSLFSPIFPLYFATDNYLRVCGKEKLSMWLSVATQVLNILLNAVMIVWLRQGVWAAAFTSCFSMALGAGITLLLFAGGKQDLFYTRLNIPFSLFLRIVANGSSELFSSIAGSVMALIFNLYLLRYGGTTAVAAFSVVMYVDSIVGMLIFGMCEALQPAISYCYGARLYKKVGAIFRRVLFASALVSLASMLFMMFVGRFVAPVFIKPGNTELFDVSVAAMKLFSFSYLVGWVDMCFSSFFTSLERPVRSLLTSLFGTLVFPVACLALLTPLRKLDGVWLTPTVAGAMSAVLVLFLAVTLRFGGRKKTN